MTDIIRAERCTSCGIRRVDRGFTSFKCPACSKVIIGRCPECKDQSTNYTCKECGFVGP